MNKFVLASHNANKIKEMKEILGCLGIEVVALPDGAPEPVEDGATFEENAIIKAKAAAKLTGLPAIADDSGLCIDALGGAPGVYSARYCNGTDADRNAFLLKNMEGQTERSCRFVCAIACVLSDGQIMTVRGECTGELLNAAQGTGGFGYDPLFYVPEESCTFGQLPAARKNQLSHRRKALERLQDVLREKINSTE